MTDPAAPHQSSIARPPLRITILAAGAAGMYCGSCIRDNALALALRRMGHDAVLLPLYTPVKTDAENASLKTVYYGGVNIWLQHVSGIFRHTPRFLDWLFDRPRFLTWAGTRGAQTSPSQLGDITLDIIRGDSGHTIKELRRLATFLKNELKPNIITLPNLMFIGAARFLKEQTGAAVIAECTGEDIFLDAMAEPWKSEAQKLIRQRAGDVDRFIATSHYYAHQMAAYLDIPEGKIDVVYPGIPETDLASIDSVRNRQSSANGESSDPSNPSHPSLGYLARICPEKGIDRLIDAALLLQQKSGHERTQVRAAGYLGKAHQDFYAKLEKRIQQSPLARQYTYLGEVDRLQKLSLFDTSTIACTPTAYPEPKGLYVLEALARGCPVALPHHGSFPELIDLTHGGFTTPPGDANAMANALASLLDSPQRRQEMSQAGHAAIHDHFLDTHMAQGMLEVFERARARG